MCLFTAATVGLVQDKFTVDEGIGTFKVCVEVKRPTITCPIDFRFTVHVRTQPGSAGMVEINTQHTKPQTLIFHGCVHNREP